MISRLKAKVANFTLRILKWRLTSFTRAQKIGTYFTYCAVTIFGIVLVACLYIPIAQYAITKFKNLDTIFIAIGGMIGTMLALVFSLSIIPIQRAVETFSSLITWLYRNDRTTQCIYITLAVFCLLSFAMSIDGIFNLQISKLLPVGIIMVAITLDLLRWHFRRIQMVICKVHTLQLFSNRWHGQATLVRVSAKQYNILNLQELYLYCPFKFPDE